MEPETIEETLKDAENLHRAAMELADTLDAEMETPEHEHVRGSLVRRLGVLVEEYANGYASAVVAGQELGTEYGRQLIRTERAEALAAQEAEFRDEWKRLAMRQERYANGLSAKLVRRAAKLGRLRKANKFLAEEVARVEVELEDVEANLIAHLRTKGAELKAARKAHREAAAANLRFADTVAMLRRRLRDSNLRKLNLAFGEGGMQLDIGAKVAEPVDEATDRALLDVIAGALSQCRQDGHRLLPDAALQREAVAVLDALRDVER